MKKVLSLMLAGIALLANQSHSVTFFADNFEASGAAGATRLSSPWEMNKQVFTSTGGYDGGYYPGTTFGPNAIVSGQGGVDQGTYQGKLWPDYDGWWGDWTDNKVVKTSLLVSIVSLSAADIAPGQIQMDFDYKLQGELGPNTSVYSFAKIHLYVVTFCTRLTIAFKMIHKYKKQLFSCSLSYKIVHLFYKKHTLQL